MKPARFALIFFSAFIAALAIVRLLLAWSEPRTYGSNMWAKARIHASLEALANPELRGRNLVLFLGASEAMTGFDPIEYDLTNKSAGRATWSLNLAVHNVGTFLPLYFDRIALEIVRARLRPKIIFVNFPISRLTTASQRHFSEMQKTHDLPAAYFDAELWGTSATFQDKVEMAINKWIFGERSLMQIPLMFSRAFKFNTNQLIRRADTNFMTVMLADPARAWLGRGRFYDGVLESSPGVVASKQSTIRFRGWEEMAAENERCCDFEELRIDQKYAAEVLDSLGRLRRLADKVVIVHLAENRLYRRSSASEERRQEFLKRAADDQEVWSFAYPPFEYVDLLHLSPRGSIRFSKDLAEHTPSNWFRTENR